MPRKDADLRKVAAWLPRHARERVMAKAEVIRTLAKAHGAISIALFGSAARGDERPDSDLDFMVDLEPGRSLLDLIGLAEDLQTLLGRKVEAVTWRSASDHLSDVVEAIDAIERYTKGGLRTFEREEMVRDAVAARLIQIGQAVKDAQTEGLDLAALQPAVPWRAIAGLRDRPASARG